MTTATDEGPAEPARGRRTRFWLLLAALVYLTVEGLALLAHGLIRGEWLSLAENADRRLRVAAAQAGDDDLPEDLLATEDWRGDQIPHPFLGFVRHPRRRPPVNAHGFFGPDPLQSATAERVLQVAVTGGSFAAQMAGNASRRLTEKLFGIPHYRGRQVIVHNLAMAGGKQPQQLAALTYFEALGARFELVINIDGFNEVVLGAQNVRNGIYPHFSSLWHYHLSRLPDADLLSSLGESRLLGARRKAWARGLWRLRFSATAQVLWRVLDEHLAHRQATIAADIDRRLRERSQAEHLIDDIRGPATAFDAEEDLYAEIARVWGRSSVAMHDLLCARGDVYLHFLQPNLHLPDSKPLTDEERTGVEAYYHRPLVLAGYPHVRREGARLAEAGLPFSDLTGMFRDQPETRYSDPCCHLNATGYEEVVDQVIEAIARRHHQLRTTPCHALRPTLDASSI